MINWKLSSQTGAPPGRVKWSSQMVESTRGGGSGGGGLGPQVNCKQKQVKHLTFYSQNGLFTKAVDSVCVGGGPAGHPQLSQLPRTQVLSTSETRNFLMQTQREILPFVTDIFGFF